MARILILANEVPQDIADGWHMRVFNLCRVAREKHDLSLFVVPVRPGGDSLPTEHFFEQVTFFPCHTKPKKSGVRILRTTDADYLKRWSPDYYESLRQRLMQVCSDWNIDVIANFSGLVAEVPPTLGLPCIIDITDSRTLTLERRLANRETQQSVKTRIGLMLKKWRFSKREQATVRIYDVVTTIGRQDRQSLIDVSGKDPGQVMVIPNGVAEAALVDLDPDRPRTRSVVFWGNLDFSPNRTAIAYFHEKIFLPFLADRGIDWHIVGGGAGAAIRRLGEHTNIHLHGYVDDLYGFISDKGLMVNPMVEGSGLKNKVLEAFALGIPVVSTSMGIDAIAAVDGEHFLQADTASRFAEHVVRLTEDRDEARRLVVNARELVEEVYTWDAVGDAFDEVIRGVLSR